MAVDPARAKSLFLNASDLNDPAERAAYLEGECGDDAELRNRVEALLRASEGSPLTVPATEDATIDSAWALPAMGATSLRTLRPDLDPPSPPIPISIPNTAEYRGNPAPNVLIAGRYTLQEKIGEGGMGEVWVAKQSEPVKRKVALKLIKPGMDSRAVLQRFEQERQALAMMDHPNIAKVLDAGLTPDGQPFFAMELVNGLPLNRFCDEARLTTKDRLELFVTICQAVQHAHQKGIVHRDLKPANILVTIIDGRPVPKVIDFGVAKATAGKLTDESMSTQFGAIVGTLEYMSPEQAGFSGEDIDTRADIYSLGVILYEMLTGLRPIDAKRLKKAAITEMIRIIREEDPSKPSTRLSTDEALPSMAALRQIEPRRLMALLRGELDWVVMKCLEKHRERRYETANGLAKDIQRYLAAEPVEARPPSASYRFNKFLQRNKGPVIAATVILLAVLGGLSSVLAVQARANHDLAVKNQELLKERAKVQARYDLAFEAIGRFHTGVSEDFLLKQDQFKAVRDRLLQSASEFYGKLGALLGKESDQASRQALWQANFELAVLTSQVGRREDALAAHRQVLAAREALAAENLTDTVIKAEVGRSLTDIAFLLESTGHSQEAEATYRKAELLLAKPVPTIAISGTARLILARCRSRLGGLLRDKGRNDEALSVYRLARVDQESLAASAGASSESRRELGHTINDIGLLLAATGKPSEAETEYRKALAIYQKVSDDNPAVANFRSSLANCHGNLGLLLGQTGKSSEAETEFREALTTYQKLADDNPAIIPFRTNMARIRLNHGDLLADTGKLSEAATEFREALATYQKLADDHPTVTDFRFSIAGGQNGLAYILAQVGKSLDAETEYRKALATSQKLADEDPTVIAFRQRLAKSQSGLGWLLSEIGRFSDAETEYRKARVLYQKLADDNPTVIDLRSHLARAQLGLGWVLSQIGKSSEAEAEFREARALYQKLADDSPAVIEFRSLLASSHVYLGELLSGIGKSSEAEAEFLKALTLHQKLVDDNPAISQFQRELAQNLRSIGLSLAASGRMSQAIGFFTRELAIRRHLAEASQGTHADKDRLGDCQTNTADALRQSGNLDEALAACESALMVREPLVKAHPEIPSYRAGLGETYLRLGQVRSDMKNLAGAATAWKLACEHIGKSKVRDGLNMFLLACSYACLAGVASRTESNVSAAEGAERAEQAMAALRQAITAGYRDTNAYRTESALDPLRARPDFRALLLDHAFPTNPFAR